MAAEYKDRARLYKAKTTPYPETIFPLTSMTHYICKGGCNGVADRPGTCQAADCADYQKDLIACDCEDGAHGVSQGSAEQ